MLTRVISGGQTGVDQAALRAAKAAGLETGGVAPKGYRTESGPAPWLDTTFGLTEAQSADYASRTRQNIAAADATLVFQAMESAGTDLTVRQCDRQKKPVCSVRMERPHRQLYLSAGAETPMEVAAWLVSIDAKVLNVAGHRESVCPGIGEFVERYLAEVFRTLSAGPRP